MAGDSSNTLSRRDLDFLLYEWLRVEELTSAKRYREHGRETFDALLDVCQQIAERDFVPHNKLSDQHEPVLDGGTVKMVPDVQRALDRYVEAGLVAAGLDESVGGGQVPHAVMLACNAWFQAANAATFSYPFLTVANARLLQKYGSPDQVRRFVIPMAAGRYFGTMCLSEPQAGSALSEIATKAVPQDDGSFRLFGTKMWISAGEHELAENIVHLVLARTPGAPAGVKGLSLFIVPKFLVRADGTLGDRNDVTLVGLNHKMGYRGTTNTVLSFGEGTTFLPEGRAGAVGYLVGEVNRGLSYMFHMMNEARVGVGAGAAALGYTAYLKSLAYARTRQQGRALSNGNGVQVSIIEHPDVRRMLLAQKCYVEGALALILYCGRLLDEHDTADSPDDAEQIRRLLEILTPIAKSWPAQWCLEANHLAIQVHGGYGYTRDYDVEQHYRDNRLNQIHEGTHGIQALDLLGRKVVVDDGAYFTLLVERIRSTVARAQEVGGEAAQLSAMLARSLDRLQAVTATLWRAEEPLVALTNASVYLEAAGGVVLAWIWLEQLLACGGRDEPFYEGKRQAARYFYRFELPRTDPQFDLLERLDSTVRDMEPDWF